MLRHPLFPLTVLILAAAAVVGLYAFGPDRSGKRREFQGSMGRAPLLEIGLGRCLRDAVVRISVHGPYRIRGGSRILASGDRLPWVEVEARDGIAIGSAVFRESSVTLIPQDEGTVEVEYSRDSRGNPVKPGGVRYPGTLTIHLLPERKLALVVEVELEEYLKGVVGKEMHLAEGVEALKAQVIAARTYAVHEQQLGRIRRVKGEVFDLYDDERSQMYGGLERKTGLAERLVDETRGQFVTYEGKLVRTFYSSACGGHTEPAWEVMTDETERTAPLSGTRCDYCQRRAIYRWKEPAVISKRAIAEKCLPKEFQDRKIRAIEISRTLPGGHALELTVGFENSSRVVHLNAANDFRRNLPEKLRSTLWDRIEDRGDSIAIYGRGYGHGAGLCQVGAYEMAKDGKTAAEILEYYFPGAKVVRLY